VTIDPSFDALIRRVRARDPQASAELVRRFEPEIRRYVRVKINDWGLRPLVDSADVCQSVLGNFFVRLVAGQFELTEPHQLLKLLVRMAGNKLRDHHRRPAVRRLRLADDAMLNEVPAGGGAVDDGLSFDELLDAALRSLSDAERALADRRVQGKEWKDIAAEFGGSPDALRKQLGRAIDRVCTELGLDCGRVADPE
jgi:RNA polymerase sigma factor (sigma-70 family)